MMKKSAILVVCSLLAASLATTGGLAGPGKAVTRLIDTPPSLFTLGLIRLEEMVASRLEHFSFAPPLSGDSSYGRLVAYHWDENVVSVVLYGVPPPTDIEWDYEEECRQSIAMLRTLAWIDDETGKLIDGTYSLFGEMFLQRGYNTDSLDGVAAEIDKIIRLQVNTSGPTCTAPLLGTGFSIKR